MWENTLWNEEAYKSFKAYLISVSEGDYRKFYQKLVPEGIPILGIRMPRLRAIGKEIAKGDGSGFLSVAGREYHEEVMVQGIVIGAMKYDLERLLRGVTRFVPLISNWALCDCFVSGLKIKKEDLSVVWSFLQPYLRSENEYDVRFAAVMLMRFFTDEVHLDRLFEIYDSVAHPGYYVKMAVAWAVSEAYVKFPKETMAYLNRCRLEDWTYQKTLQKIIESRRVTEEERALLRKMKKARKEKKT